MKRYLIFYRIPQGNQVNAPYTIYANTRNEAIKIAKTELPKGNTITHCFQDDLLPIGNDYWQSKNPLNYKSYQKAFKAKHEIQNPIQGEK
jgi:hypothetical protein